MLMFSSVHLRSSSSTNLVKDNEQKQSHRKLTKTLLCPRPPNPPVGYAILKDFSYLLGAKLSENNFIDVMTIDQWEIEGFSMT